MRIINMMLGTKRGGIEQAVIDYAEAMQHQGIEVLNVFRKDAWAMEASAYLNQSSCIINPLSRWDPLTTQQLRKRGEAFDAQAVIAHGNRAIQFALRAFGGRIPVIAVAHNYHIKRFPQCDAAFTITRDLYEELAAIDMPRHTLFHVPNMVRVPDHTPRSAFHSPVRIGSMGRFVAKKGFPCFVKALGELHQRGVPFHGILGGDGPELNEIQRVAERAGLPILTRAPEHSDEGSALYLPGWVNDKWRFFEEIDIFALPSHHEPFGIVLIEAMAAGLPTVTTASEGPCEIITQHQDAVMVDLNDHRAMADAFEAWIASPETALNVGNAAYDTAKRRYALSEAAKTIEAALRRVIFARPDTRIILSA